MRLTAKHLAGTEAWLLGNADHELGPAMLTLWGAPTDEAALDEFHDEFASLLRDRGDGKFVTTANLGVLFDYLADRITGRFGYAPKVPAVKVEQLWQAAGAASYGQMVRAAIQDLADLMGVKPAVPPTASALHQAIVAWRKRLEAAAVPQS